MIIGEYLRFTHVRNPGIAFGISVGDYRVLLALISIIATIFIIYLHSQEKNSHPLISSSFGLILGGALGNMIDRSMIIFNQNFEGVIDFLDVGFGDYRWYIFNVADSAVTIGIILYIIYSLLFNKSEILSKSD